MYKIKSKEKVESQMIWGFQWNLACDFISKKGEKRVSEMLLLGLIIKIVQGMQI